MMRPCKVTFHMDGTGVHFDPAEPPMLDGILTSALCRWHVHGEPPARDEHPVDIPLPLSRWDIGGVWGWRASALLPDGKIAESVQCWRKRFRQDRVEVTDGSPNLTMGTYRDWNQPMPLMLCTTLVGYFVGDRRKVLRALRRDVKYIGKKRAHGRGAVIGVQVVEVDDDHSCVRDGVAMRWLPASDGHRLVRPRPPYWNSCDRVASCEVGDAVEVPRAAR